MIQLENITKIYQMGTVKLAALDGVSLSIQDGELVFLMGPSGSGKSTLMNILGCLDAPTSGTFILYGENVGSLSDDRLAEIRNSKIGFVFQTYNLLPRLNALSNVELALMYGNSRNRKKRSREALERVGLGDRVGHRPTELSGGEQQRVGIARALVKEPDILLADEPTGNLDSRSSEEILQILERLNDDGITVIIVTHEPDIAARTGRVLTMRDGQIVSQETKEQARIQEGQLSGGGPRS